MILQVFAHLILSRGMQYGSRGSANSFACDTINSVLTNMVSQSTLDLISWKILLKNCCLKCLIRHVRWWAALSDSRRIRSYLNTDPVVKQLTYYIGLYDLYRKRICFCCFNNLFENSLNVQCIHDISHLL